MNKPGSAISAAERTPRRPARTAILPRCETVVFARSQLSRRPTAVVFGDKAHYAITLTRTGDITASAKVDGRRFRDSPPDKGLKRRQYCI
jgi:hypothetical protein